MRYKFAATLAFVSTACAATPVMTGSPGGAPPPAARPSQEALRASLTQAELDFAAATAARGVDGWVEAFAENGRLLNANGVVVQGKAAIRANMMGPLAKVKLTWWPTLVEVAPEGDMGFTHGPYEVKVPDAQGKLKLVSHGAYLTVWRRQPDGAWKVVADFGSEDKTP